MKQQSKHVPTSELAKDKKAVFELPAELRSKTAADKIFCYLRPPQAADYTGLSESTLAKLRMRDMRDSGPKYIKLSGCVIYRRSDLDAWMDEHVIEGNGNA